ncbi:MAG TPA: hypothetical protein VKF42_11900 [Chitinivibrionales bacterium]|nr:hypothetical protein [Chitinivibrionales bacterium]
MKSKTFVDWFYQNCNHGEDMAFARKVWDACEVAAEEENRDTFEILLKACEAARAYLEQRGVRTRGTVGRTIVLPLLDEAIKKAGSSTEAGTVIV